MIMSAIPSWGVQPFVAPGEVSPQRVQQWENFKQHIGSWVGDWTFYDATAPGPPLRHAHSSRVLVLRPPTGDPACPELVDQTNTLKEQLEGTEDSQKFFLHSATDPPRFIEGVDKDGHKLKTYPGIIHFSPTGCSFWLVPPSESSVGMFYSERLILHPHVPGVRLTVGIVLIPNGLKKIYLVREEDVPDRSTYAKKGVYTLDVDAAPLTTGDAAVNANAPNGYVAVEHTVDDDLNLSARLFDAENLPAIPFGDGRIAVSLPDRIDISLPVVAQGSIFAKDEELHVRWAIDRGTVLHQHSLFSRDGTFQRDTIAVYYPKSE